MTKIKIKIVTISNTDKVEEKSVHSYIAGENVKPCSNSGSEFASFLETYINKYHTSQKLNFWAFYT